MVDSLGAGSLLASILTWWESRKLRKLVESNAKSLPAIAKPSYVSEPRRRPRPRKRGPSAAAMELHRERLALERDKHEWTKVRDLANWFFEAIGEDQYDDEGDD